MESGAVMHCGFILLISVLYKPFACLLNLFTYYLPFSLLTFPYLCTSLSNSSRISPFCFQAKGHKGDAENGLDNEGREKHL